MWLDSDPALAHIDDYNAYLMSVFDSLPQRVRHALKSCAFGMDKKNMPSIKMTVRHRGEQFVIDIVKRMDDDFNAALRREYREMELKLKWK